MRVPRQTVTSNSLPTNESTELQTTSLLQMQIPSQSDAVMINTMTRHDRESRPCYRRESPTQKEVRCVSCSDPYRQNQKLGGRSSKQAHVHTFAIAAPATPSAGQEKKNQSEAIRAPGKVNLHHHPTRKQPQEAHLNLLLLRSSTTALASRSLALRRTSALPRRRLVRLDVLDDGPPGPATAR